MTLSITIDLMHGVSLEFMELSDGSTSIKVTGAAPRSEGKREKQILGNHKAKFADLMSVLCQDRVVEAAAYVEARLALKRARSSDNVTNRN